VWYLAAGVVILAVVFISHRLTTKGELTSSKSLVLDGLIPERRALRYRFLNDVVVPVLAGMAVVFAWPVVIAMRVRAIFFKGAEMPVEERKAFAVSRGDLLEWLAIGAIEGREGVVDPMEAVPDVPFGHLNAAWRKFLAGVGPEDAIWSFSTNWTNTWGRKEVRAGYVVVRGDSIGPHFLTVRRTLDGK